MIKRLHIQTPYHWFSIFEHWMDLITKSSVCPFLYCLGLNAHWILNIAIDTNIKCIEAKVPKLIQNLPNFSWCQIRVKLLLFNCAALKWDVIVQKVCGKFPCNCQPKKTEKFSVIVGQWKVWSGFLKTETCWPCCIVGLWKVKCENFGQAPHMVMLSCHPLKMLCLLKKKIYFFG